MHKQNILIKVCEIFLLIFLLAGCATNDVNPTQQPVNQEPTVVLIQTEIKLPPSPSLIVEETKIPEDSPTPILLQADTENSNVEANTAADVVANATATPTFTATPSITEDIISGPSVTPHLIMPGLYLAGGCAVKLIDPEATFYFCITSTTVKPNRYMVFNLSWQIKYVEPQTNRYLYRRRSLQPFNNLYLVDNLGNRYDLIGGGGDAYERPKYRYPDNRAEGWLEFPKPHPGAVTFNLHDDGLDIVIKNIALVQPTVIYETYPLTNKNFNMYFNETEWELVKSDGGELSLEHREQKSCTIQEIESKQSRGTLKNTIKLGKASFDIFSEFDSNVNQDIRNYKTIGGFENLGVGVLPQFEVKIPNSDSLSCIFDASQVLSTLDLAINEEEAVTPNPPYTSITSTPESDELTDELQGPTATPHRVLPGYYPAGGCDTVTLKGNAKHRVCVLNVTVTKENTMIINVSWDTKFERITFTPIGKQRDNKKLYLKDRLGNIYPHIGGGGDGYHGTAFVNREHINGWFVFKAPSPGVFSFTFLDDERGVEISNIRLEQPVIIYQEFMLSNSSFVLEYHKDEWDIVEEDNGEIKLSHKNIPSCTIQEHPEEKPEGKLKNTTVFGNTVYQIYSYYDNETQIMMREYLATAMLSGVDPGALPMFLVHLPEEDQQQCLFDASDVLGRLSFRSP